MAGPPVWNALEANPEVIARYIQRLGGPNGVSVSDVLSVEDWGLQLVPRPVLALLLVYPITPASEDFKKGLEASHASDTQLDAYRRIWFTKQTVSNACGTVALLHVFANLREKYPPAHGGALDTFLQKTKDMDPSQRAKALETCDGITTAHHVTETEGQSQIRGEDVSEHFVAFIRVGEQLVELDGRKSGPIIHQPTSEANLLEDAVAVVKRNYMEVDPEQLNFCLLAITEAEATTV